MLGLRGSMIPPLVYFFIYLLKTVENLCKTELNAKYFIIVGRKPERWESLLLHTCGIVNPAGVALMFGVTGLTPF